MKDINKNKCYNVKININNKIEELIIPNNYLISELKQNVLDKYLLPAFKYSIFYKNRKLSINDFHRVTSLFTDDKNPILFIIENKVISSDSQTNNVVGISSNFNEKRITELIGKFFEYKSIPFSAIIKKIIKGEYKIKFNKPLLAQEFIQFYNITKDKKIKINSSASNLKLPKLNKNKYHSISTGDLMERNQKEYYLNRVITNNTKDMFITQKTVESGMNIYHDSINNNRRKKQNDDYKGEYYLPFLNPDEKYYREKYLDKKNWLDKKGFFLSVGNYKMGGGSNFIPNYVSATPSKSPLCHHFRDVRKNKWLNKKGFFL